MDITNCRLKRTSFQDTEGTHMYGFILTARHYKHEFHSDSKEYTE